MNADAYRHWIGKSRLMASPQHGVTSTHTYWSSVCTSGWVDVEVAYRGFTDEIGSQGAPRMLPPGLRATLKDVVGNDAFIFRDDMGVMRVPAHVLEPWHR